MQKFDVSFQISTPRTGMHIQTRKSVTVQLEHVFHGAWMCDRNCLCWVELTNIRCGTHAAQESFIGYLNTSCVALGCVFEIQFRKAFTLRRISNSEMTEFRWNASVLYQALKCVHCLRSKLFVWCWLHCLGSTTDLNATCMRSGHTAEKFKVYFCSSKLALNSELMVFHNVQQWPNT